MPAPAYDPLGELSDVGGLLEKATGGRALKGLLAGKPRELASVIPFSDRMGWTDPTQATTGRDLTDLYHLTQKGDTGLGSRAIGFGADILANPLSLFGGVQAFRAAPTVAKGLLGAAKSVTGADVLENAVRGGTGLLKGEAGWLTMPQVRSLARTEENPLGRFAALAKVSPAQLDISQPALEQAFQYPRATTPGQAFALYQPSTLEMILGGGGRTRRVPGRMLPNPNWEFWGSTQRMNEKLRRLEATGRPQPLLHPDLIAAHEAGHAFHQKELDKSIRRFMGDPTDVRWRPEGLDRGDIEEALGPYALVSPHEFVAEAFAKQLLGQENLPPTLQRMYQDFLGPDPNRLPSKFLGKIGEYLAREPVGMRP